MAARFRNFVIRHCFGFRVSGFRHCSASFGAEGFDGVDARGAIGRQETGEQRDRREKDRNAPSVSGSCALVL